MKLLKKAVLGAAMALTFSGAQASLINVGGVYWDPDWVAGGFSKEKDFAASSSFTQWFSTSATANPPQGAPAPDGTAVPFGNVLTALATSPTYATGLYLTGVGEFTRLNDPARSTTTGSPIGGGPGSFCPGCELTYVFGGIGLNKDSTFDVSNAFIKIYVDSTPDFNPPHQPARH